MSFLIAKPSEILSPYVLQYWMIENCVKQGNNHIQRIVPSGLTELTIYLGDRPKVLDKNDSITENTVLSGQVSHHHDIEVKGTLDMFSVSFKPEGAMMLFDLPMDNLTDQYVPLRYIQKDITTRIETKLYESSGFAERVAVIEEFLISQLTKNFKEFIGKRIKHNINLINQNRGNISIDNLASGACLSRKQYGRIFKESIGISPKRFLRIVRFQHAIYQKQLNNSITLTNLTYACGYFDQSHMISDFKELTGMTPKEYFASCDMAFSDYFSF